MEKSVQITLIISAAVLVLALAGIATFTNLSTGTTINTNGKAEIKALPNLVTVYFNVQTEAKTSQEANQNNSAIVDEMITSLIKLGFERKDIVTENFNIYPRYDWTNNKQTLIGYTATHSVKVQLSTNQTDKIGSVIDAGVDAGALISYINFELSLEKQNEYKAEALKQATEDARIKAESIALGSGMKLGKLVSISDSSFDYYPWPLYASGIEMGVRDASEAKTAATNIQPGEQTISASISAVYKLN